MKDHWPGWIWFSLFCFCFGGCVESCTWRNRAIDHNAAHIEVDKYGWTSFHWNDEEPK